MGQTQGWKLAGTASCGLVCLNIFQLVSLELAVQARNSLLVLFMRSGWNFGDCFNRRVPH